MEIIKDTINAVMQGLAQKKKAAGDDTRELLKKVLTKNELAHIKCNYFRKGILGILVDSSSVYYKLNLRKNELIEKLSKELSGIEDISLRMGDLR
ncbi:MAG: DciA family protein [Candidatus Omnitrophota bacterium]|nr:DciA family protein [Candidatus Omnitrophota bacterium]